MFDNVGSSPEMHLSMEEVRDDLRKKLLDAMRAMAEGDDAPLCRFISDTGCTGYSLWEYFKLLYGPFDGELGEVLYYQIAIMKVAIEAAMSAYAASPGSLRSLAKDLEEL